jgi:hypothetical protein
MDIDTLMIDEVTGGSIIAGCIGFDLAGAAHVDVPAHRLILLDFSSGSLACRPVTSVERLETGFCKAAAAFPVVKLNDLSADVLAGFAKDSVVFDRTSTEGSVSGGGGHGARVTGYTLRERKVSEGVKFYVNGSLDLLSVEESVQNAGHATFVIDGLIPWQTITIKSFSDYSNADRYLPKAELLRRNVDREPRNPHRLSDITISASGQPYVAGKLKLGRRGEPATTSTTCEAIQVRVEDDVLAFSDMDRLDALTGGFCQSSYGRHLVRIKTLGRRVLDQSLRNRDTSEFAGAGDQLGSLSSLVYTGEINSSGQEISAFTLNASLGKDGLTIHVHGELRDFPPYVYADCEQRRQRRPVPWHHFEVEAMLPTALLKVRDIVLAKRPPKP